MVEFVRYVSAQVRGNPGLSCGEVANEGVRSLRQCTNLGNSGLSCGEVANERVRSLRQCTNSGNSGLSCG